MTEPTRDELMRRIEQLERANRRWRRRSFIVAGVAAVGIVVLMAENYRNVMNARQKAELARQQAERAMQDAIEAQERARQGADEAEKHLHESILRLKSQPNKANEIPLELYDGLWPLRPISQPHSKLPRPPWNLYDGAKIPK
jgi:capsule polysaccharide export protein KpsE/RkpR